MRSTFWPNRIFERQSSQDRLSHWPEILFKKGNQCAFQVVSSTFCPYRIFEGQTSENRYTCRKFSSKRENSRFPWNLYKTLFSGREQHVLAKSHLWASKLSKSLHWPQILSKKGKQCAFHEIYTKRSFQVMRSTFWANRIFERQSCQNRHTGLKFSSKRENSALSIKFVQNVLFRPCAASFG